MTNLHPQASGGFTMPPSMAPILPLFSTHPDFPSLQLAARKLHFLFHARRHLLSLQHLSFPACIDSIETEMDRIHAGMQTLAPEYPNLPIKAFPTSEEVFADDDEVLTIAHSIQKGSHVVGSNTKIHREAIRAVGFRWRFLGGEKFWRIMGTPGKLPKPSRLIYTGLVLLETVERVRLDLEDASPDTYIDGEIARLEQRSDAAAARAAKAEDKSNAQGRAAMDMARVMQGEPIKVGHHSERRHRRDIERMDSRMRQAVELGKKAERLRDRADSRQGRADWLRDQQALKASGEAGRIEANRIEFQAILRKDFKKIHPIIRTCFKDAEGKGSSYWALYTVGFFDRSMTLMRLEVGVETVSFSHYAAGQRLVILKIEDPKETFEKLRIAFKQYVSSAHQPVLINSPELYARFDVDDFAIHDKRDQHNQPRTISRAGASKKDLLKVYEWAQENRARFETMNYLELNRVLHNETGVYGHSYCAMD